MIKLLCSDIAFDCSQCFGPVHQSVRSIRSRVLETRPNLFEIAKFSGAASNDDTLHVTYFEMYESVLIMHIGRVNLHGKVRHSVEGLHRQNQRFACFIFVCRFFKLICETVILS